MPRTDARIAFWSVTVGATLMLADDAAAQTLTVGAPTGTAPRAVPVVVLRPRYQIRLESAWPVPQGETDACNNRASDRLEGSLYRVGPNRYEGRFARETRLGFCGTHGTAVDACSAVLRGEGYVAVVGEVSAEAGGRPTMTLVWQPVPETTRTDIEGTCAPRFTEALEAMYRNSVHSVDFPVPAREHERIPLEDYGRTVDIR
ncbi:MAG TPA: hypothetical protein VFM14_08400 [Gemmatimonadales bacterium]|nr:hypothetical protein [Gemmatimonadales bacterium]